MNALKMNFYGNVCKKMATLQRIWSLMKVEVCAQPKKRLWPTSSGNWIGSLLTQNYSNFNKSVSTSVCFNDWKTSNRKEETQRVGSDQAN